MSSETARWATNAAGVSTKASLAAVVFLLASDRHCAWEGDYAAVGGGGGLSG